VAPGPANRQERINGSGKNSRRILITGPIKGKANRPGRKEIAHTGQYRSRNLEYRERNRQLQQERDRKRCQTTDRLAKMDTLSRYFNDTTATYYIYAGGENLAKKDALLVKIITITPG